MIIVAPFSAVKSVAIQIELHRTLGMIYSDTSGACSCNGLVSFGSAALTKSARR